MERTKYIFILIFLLFGIGLIKADDINAGFSVVLTTPANNSILTDDSVNFNYTPIWYDVPMTYCEVSLNGLGNTENTTPLTNDTINTIIWNLSDGDYVGYIECFNGTDENTSDTIYFSVNAYKGIVANLTFDENSGGYANDSSPFGNNCTINNASWVTGVQGSALEFNGIDSYLDCGNDSSLNFGTGDFTLMAWFKVDNSAGIQTPYLIDKWDAPTTSNEYCLVHKQDGNIRVQAKQVDHVKAPL